MSKPLTRLNQRRSAISRLTDAQAAILQLAVDEEGLRWGPGAMYANILRRDIALRLEGAGLLQREEPRPPVRAAWSITDAGRATLQAWHAAKAPKEVP